MGLVPEAPERLLIMTHDGFPRGGGVLLDRDGVINREVDLLHKADQLKLIPRAADGIRLLNRSGRRVIVVTNQSVVARGLVSLRGLAAIHRALRQMLAEQGAKLDAIFSCPFHEHADLPLFRHVSDLRKPACGMLLKAARRFHLELGRSFLVGDQTGDIEAGWRAGCKTIIVRTGHGGRDGKYAVQPDFVCEDLFEAAELIIGLPHYTGLSSPHAS